MTWKNALAVALIVLGLASAAPADHILPAINKGNFAIALEPVATGLGAPTYLTYAPGDPNRQFVVDQVGLLRVIQNGVLQAAPALDVRSQLTPLFNPGNRNDERGFLGVAFHPNFNNPGQAGFRTLYTFTSDPAAGRLDFPLPVPTAVLNFRNVVSEWKMNADNTAVDQSTRREVLTIGKNAGNHNGGTIAFDRQDFLFIAPGDGGNANDAGPSHIEPGGNAQNLTTVLGKTLRIDPLLPSLTDASRGTTSANGQYRNPNDNPFSGPGELREIYAYGLRNPFRFSFDRDDGRLLMADVGQNQIEEVNIITRGGNYGWARKEGSFLFDRATGMIGAQMAIPGLIDPVLEYDHGDGIAVIGGFVYRGSEIPELFGKYIFGDLARTPAQNTGGRLFYADLATGEIFEFVLQNFVGDLLGHRVLGFGEDQNGELYVLVSNGPPNGSQGIVFKITGAVPEPGSLVLLGIGLTGLLGYGWRRRQRRA